MSVLTVYHQSSPELPSKLLTHADDIAVTLAEQGVEFARRPLGLTLAPGADEQAVIDACQGLFEPPSFEVISAWREQGARREAYVQARSYDQSSQWLFVAGQGVVYVHVGEWVYAVQCERDDSLSVEAGVVHWFDMGEEPHVVALRVSAGTRPHYPGNDVSNRFLAASI